MFSFFDSLFTGIGNFFSGTTPAAGTTPGAGTSFGLENVFAQSLPGVTQFLLQRAIGNRLGGAGAPLANIASGLLNQAFSAGNVSGGTPPIISSFGGPNLPKSGSFRASNGQSMAQLAAALTRASRRYL